MRYPIKIVRDGKFYLVTFPDIPEAATQGNTPEDARAHALDALETALEFYFEEGREVPPPSRVRRSGHFVDLPPSAAAKVLLLNEMLRQNVRPVELARRLRTTKQEVNRLTDLRHATKIDGIAQAMSALGKRLEVTAA